MNRQELAAKRKNLELTQQSLADILGVTQVTVARWECGLREIPSFLHLALRCIELEKGVKKQTRAKSKSKKKGVI